ncbi:MAG: ABC transporter ATP-binding protein [Arenicella sp.]
MSDLINIQNISKTYQNGFNALDDVSLSIKKGEILALLGPNGAGKTTLISIICGLVSPTNGSVKVNNFDIIKDYRQTRQLIGLVPQELTNNQFDTVLSTVNFTRGMFGKGKNDALVEELLKDLSLWEKRHNLLMQLSGGMKRRVLIAKALAHEPEILFLDEPTAGVDVELRQDMWRLIHKLRERGVTIILTTHYIEEAEEMADRVGVINRGKLLLVEEKSALMGSLGKKALSLDLVEPLLDVPEILNGYDIELVNHGMKLIYSYDNQGERTGISSLMQLLAENNIRFSDLHTEQSSLEEIFIDLLHEPEKQESKEVIV